MEKSAEAFRTISEVSGMLNTPAHVLRFWESRFTQIRPVKRAGGRRYYRPSDVALLGGIKRLLHDEGLTIRGVQKVLREQGIRHVAALALTGPTLTGPTLTGPTLTGPALTGPTPPLNPQAASGADQRAEATVASEPAIGVQPRAVRLRKTQGPRPVMVESPGAVPGNPGDPLPLWAAAVERVSTRPTSRKPLRQITTDAQPDEGTAWLPPLLRAMPRAVVATHRARLIDLQARLLALRNRVADAARDGGA